MGETVAVLDFETTGLSPDQGARATEVAVVVVEAGAVVARFESLMNAGAWIPPFIEQLTGITNAMVRQAPPAAEVMRALARFVGSTPLVAHNAAFDRRFLDAELGRIGLARGQGFLCSMRIARRVYPEAPDHRLATLVSYAGLPVRGRHHRALADAEMAADLWIKMGSDLVLRFGLADIPLDLMRRIQAIPRQALPACIRQHCRRHQTTDRGRLGGAADGVG